MSKGWERVYAPNVKFNFTFGFHKLSKVKLLFEFTSVKLSVPVFFGDNFKKKKKALWTHCKKLVLKSILVQITIKIEKM